MRIARMHDEAETITCMRSAIVLVAPAAQAACGAKAVADEPPCYESREGSQQVDVRSAISK